MKIFKDFNRVGETCHICGLKTSGTTTLIPLDGTASGSIEEALQVHVECLDLRIKKVDNKLFIYQIEGDE